MKSLSRFISIKVNIKQLALFLTVFLTSFWLFGCADYQRTNSLKKPELLGWFATFTSFNSLWKGPFKINEYEHVALEINAESDLWAKAYGGYFSNIPCSIQQTADGGYIVGGFSWILTIDGYCDMWILKLFSNGEIEWQKVYGIDEWDVAKSIRQTTDGGYIVGGIARAFGGAWIIKLFPDGEIEWQKAYGGVYGDYAHSVQQTTDGGYLVAGPSYSYGSGSSDMWILKLSPDGEIEWQKTYGGLEREWAYSIHQITDGGYIVAGTTESFGAGSEDIWILKLFPDGEIEWQKTYGGEDDDGWGDAGSSVLQTMDGGYIVAGNIKSSDTGSRDFWVLKLFPDGGIEWQKTYGGDFDKYLWSPVQQTAEGGYVLSGYATSVSYGGTDALVLKLFPDGEIEWQKVYGIGGEEARSIQQTANGGYIVAGTTEHFGQGHKNYLVLKLSPEGENEFVGLDTDLNVIVSETSISPLITSVVPADSDSSPQDTDVTPRETSASAVPILSQYTLTIAASSGGTTDPSPGSYVHDLASEVAIEALPSDGYEFSGWSGDAAGVTNPLTVIMLSDKSITANFETVSTGDDETDDSTNGKKSNCFIATAAFGSPMHPYVKTIRDFKNRYLMSSKLGSAIINLYYKYSPLAVNIIEKHKPLKFVVRAGLLPFIAFCYSMLHFGPIITAFMLALIFIIMIFLDGVGRKRIRIFRVKIY